jgi:hypothetical protein
MVGPLLLVFVVFGRATAWAGPCLGVPVFDLHWHVGLLLKGGALLASAREFAVYQHNQPLPVVVMPLVVVWVWL